MQLGYRVLKYFATMNTIMKVREGNEFISKFASIERLKSQKEQMRHISFELNYSLLTIQRV